MARGRPEASLSSHCVSPRTRAARLRSEKNCSLSRGEARQGVGRWRIRWCGGAQRRASEPPQGKGTRAPFDRVPAGEQLSRDHTFTFSASPRPWLLSFTFLELFPTQHSHVSPAGLLPESPDWVYWNPLGLFRIWLQPAPPTSCPDT